MFTPSLLARHSTAPAPQNVTTARFSHGTAANDDDLNPEATALLRAALRLFASEREAAADLAQDRATHAFFAGDRAGTRWWLAVGRALDRMLATEHAGPASSPEPDPTAGVAADVRRPRG